MLSRILAKITGADKKKKYPDQQAEIMGRIGDFTIIFPYGMYCDLPNDALAEEVKHGMLIPITVIRPDDVEQGEPVIYHPATNARVIFRNNGDIDIKTDSDVNAECKNANIVATGNIAAECVNADLIATGATTITSPTVTITGELIVTGNIGSEANITAVGVLAGNTLAVAGAGSIAGKDFETHQHAQGNDSNNDTQQNTGSVL